MPEFAIRAPSVDDLLDPYSVGVLERRPLHDEVRDRILHAWLEARKERPEYLSVQLPADERREGLDERLQTAIRNDLQKTYETSRRWRFFTRGQRREAWIGFFFLIICLLLSGMVDRASGGDPVLDGISQGFVVLGWVALWKPAELVFRGVNRRMSRKRYRELSKVPIEVTWV